MDVDGNSLGGQNVIEVLLKSYLYLAYLGLELGI